MFSSHKSNNFIFAKNKRIMAIWKLVPSHNISLKIESNCQNYIKCTINYYAVQNLNVLWKVFESYNTFCDFFPPTLRGYNLEGKHF